jgi:hypothetical protein
MPSVRTVAFAYRKYLIAIPYKQIILRDAIPPKGKEPHQQGQAKELVLPFSVETKVIGTKVNLKFDSVSQGKFQFRLIIDQAS